VVLAVLVAGFILAIVLAWIYELTGQGLKTDAELRANPGLVRVPARYLDYLIIALLTVALGYFVWESRFKESGDDGLVIAVLPMEDNSPDRSQAWFASGMTEEIMSALVPVSELNVVGRRTAEQFDPATQTLKRFAASTGITHVLEGSVRTAGNRVRISAQLVRASDGLNVWAESFDEELVDIFEIQERIAINVISGLKLHIKPSATKEEEPAQNFDAYRAYLQGRFHLSHRTAEDMQEAIRFFDESLRLDSGQSRTHSGLAAVYAFLPYYSADYDPEATRSLLTYHAQTAIDLDKHNAEAHALLGASLMYFDRDIAGARPLFDRAYELSPGDTAILNIYGDYLYYIGDFKRAVEIEGRAARLDPLSAVNQLEFGLALGFAGDYDAAIKQAHLAVELSSDMMNARWQLFRLSLISGAVGEAKTLLAENAEKMGERFRSLAEVKLAIESRDVEKARTLTEAYEREAGDDSSADSILALLYAMIGNDQKAAMYIDRAFESRDVILYSPMYFFLPEDWSHLQQTRKALDRPEMQALFDLRRRYAADTGS
jgi:serine/threonine-protein kinase